MAANKNPFLGVINTYGFNTIYDLLVIRFNNSYVWRCPTRKYILPFFQRHVTGNHIDVGPANGFYAANSPFPQESSVTLIDINPTSLKKAEERLQEARKDITVGTVQFDLVTSEKPLASLIPASTLPVRSISIFYVLHCLRQTPSQKADLLMRLGELLHPEDGVLYGTTVLGRGVEHNLLGKIQLAILNGYGFFGNYDDDASGLMEPMKNVFKQVEWEVRGVVLLFKLSGFKKQN